MLTPWIFKDLSVEAVAYERNPYYWAVDEEGNQLPYMDEIQAEIVSPELYQLKITGGDVDIAYGRTTLTNIELYKANEESGGYRTILWPGVNTAAVLLSFNISHPDPVMREIQNDIRFRQALSVAINRQELNDNLYFGLGVPRNRAVLPSVSFYQDWWADYYAQYDPELADKLLDEMGLEKKNKDGYRLRKDGDVMQLVIEYQDINNTSSLELTKEYFEAVGIKTIIKIEDGGFMFNRTSDSLQDMSVDIAHGLRSNGNERTIFYRLQTWDQPATRQWWLYDRSMQTIIGREIGLEEALPDDYLRRTPKNMDDPENVPQGEKPPEWYIEFLEDKTRGSK